MFTEYNFTNDSLSCSPFNYTDLETEKSPENQNVGISDFAQDILSKLRYEKISQVEERPLPLRPIPRYLPTHGLSFPDSDEFKENSYPSMMFEMDDCDTFNPPDFHQNEKFPRENNLSLAPSLKSRSVPSSISDFSCLKKSRSENRVQVQFSKVDYLYFNKGAASSTVSLEEREKRLVAPESLIHSLVEHAKDSSFVKHLNFFLNNCKAYSSKIIRFSSPENVFFAEAIEDAVYWISQDVKSSGLAEEEALFSFKSYLLKSMLIRTQFTLSHEIKGALEETIDSYLKDSEVQKELRGYLDLFLSPEL